MATWIYSEWPFIIVRNFSNHQKQGGLFYANANFKRPA